MRERVAEIDSGALREVSPAGREALERVHPARYLEFLRSFSAQGGGAVVERDLIVTRATWTAAEHAAGAALAAVQYACSGQGNAFAAIRPPGHHALAETPMGFCFLANAVLAAREAQRLGHPQVLIVDWDVHHGNGTQALVERDPSVRFVSLHQWPLYPGTGAAAERGVGNVFNVPRPPGLPPERYVADLQDAIREALALGVPDVVIVSAGYDSMWGDPLGGFTLEPQHYAELIETLRTECAPGPIVALLEGGYSPPLVAEGVLATLRAMI